MKKLFQHKKHIIITLLLILTISNFSMSFAYWASNVYGSQSNTNLSVSVGDWDFEDTDFLVAEFRSNHATALSLTETTVMITDRTIIEDALADYGLLSIAAKAELTSEEALLISLLVQIIALENSEFLDFEAYPYDYGLTGTIDMNGRTWYGNAVYISNDPNYDVWNDTRSLALRNGAYFESRDLFMNGVDRITIYHGALNFGNGNSFQFKIEYKENNGSWVTLQDGGSDLLVDITSVTPLSYTEIDVNITQAVNIRFTPVLSSYSDYINLDDIRIYEHVVTSSMEVTTFRTIYAGALSLSTNTVEFSDKSAVEQALSAYDLLSTDAKNILTPEKSLLDSLLLEINTNAAEDAVERSESTYLQVDVDAAQILVNLLPSGSAQSALQDRLNQVQTLITEISSFQSDNAVALSLTVGTVTSSDQTVVQAAMIDYNLLSPEAKVQLTDEKDLLDSLIAEINSQIPTATLVAQFRNNHAAVLALTTATVSINDRTSVELALAEYDLLSNDAQTILSPEKTLLDSLLVEVYLQEAEIAVSLAESTNLQADVDSAQNTVTLLPNSAEKTNLQARLDIVQNIIDIAQASIVDSLILAIPSLGNLDLTDQTQILAARDAYNNLTTSQQALVVNESVLITLEAYMISLQAANAAVVTAEASKHQADVNAAEALVNALSNGASKTNLLSRLEDVQDIIDVETASILILDYFAANKVIVRRLNRTADKEEAFLEKVDEVVGGLGVTISLINTDQHDRRNTTYTITITKNAASLTIDVDVEFSRN